LSSRPRSAFQSSKLDASPIRLYRVATARRFLQVRPQDMLVFIDVIDWDDENDPQGNTWHIVGPGEVTIEEVEELLFDHSGKVDQSDQSGNPIIFGWTTTGKHIAVIFRFEPDPDLVIVRPITAYPVPEYGEGD
jgi:hypothetical protein